MKDVLERFLGYIKVDTQSSEESDTVPTTKTQLEFAKKLGEELKAIGLKDVSVDENGYVMATLESNIDKKSAYNWLYSTYGHKSRLIRN